MTDTVPMHVYENQRAEIRLLRARLARAEKSADYWRESWEKLVQELGEKIVSISKRPTGRRFATVLELQQMLTGHGDD